MSKQTTFDKVGLLGIDVDAAANADAISYICVRAAPGQPACYVTKPYVEFLDRAYHRPGLQDLVNGAELTLADGIALVWAAHYLYAGPRSLARFWATLFKIVLAPGSLRWPLSDRTAGINFTRPLLEQAAAKGLRVYLIASPKGSTVEHAAEHLTATIPGLTIVGTRSGRDLTMPRGQVSNDWLEATATAVTAAAPDLILVGMGFPLQETVCAYLAAHTKRVHWRGRHLRLRGLWRPPPQSSSRRSTPRSRVALAPCPGAPPPPPPARHSALYLAHLARSINIPTTTTQPTTSAHQRPTACVPNRNALHRAVSS
jgi:N-acetylglucosaminyldiphosphoundecaprenol N-acetyl-beta-D-mannosaminyltransferase